MSDERFARARSFILENGRLLERRLFEVHFEGGSPGTVELAALAYRNDDGGFGHALEPDLRCAESQPLFAEIALAAIHDAGAAAESFAQSLCDYLFRIAGEDGLVPPIVRSALDAPHAIHWSERALAPDLNPTASICGLLHAQGVIHPWLEKATESCERIAIERTPGEAHTLLCVARLACHHPDSSIRRGLRNAVAQALPEATYFIAEAPVAEYGLTPLNFAPTRDSSWRELFSDGQLRGHLDQLLSDQQDDGGWPILWTPPGDGAVSEWRGIVTLRAIRTLVSYGAMEADYSSIRR